MSATRYALWKNRLLRLWLAGGAAAVGAIGSVIRNNCASAAGSRHPRASGCWGRYSPARPGSAPRPASGSGCRSHSRSAKPWAAAITPPCGGRSPRRSPCSGRRRSRWLRSGWSRRRGSPPRCSARASTRGSCASRCSRWSASRSSPRSRGCSPASPTCARRSSTRCSATRRWWRSCSRSCRASVSPARCGAWRASGRSRSSAPCGSSGACTPPRWRRPKACASTGRPRTRCSRWPPPRSASRCSTRVRCSCCARTSCACTGWRQTGCCRPRSHSRSRSAPCSTDTSAATRSG